jgi:hypothetical protein
VSNNAFSAGKEGFLDGSIDWDTATQRIALVRGYTFNDTHRFVSDMTGAGGTIVSSVVLTGKTVTGGAAGCSPNPVFPAVAAGAAIPAIVIYSRARRRAAPMWLRRRNG